MGPRLQTPNPDLASEAAAGPGQALVWQPRGRDSHGAGPKRRRSGTTAPRRPAAGSVQPAAPSPRRPGSQAFSLRTACCHILQTGTLRLRAVWLFPAPPSTLGVVGGRPLGRHMSRLCPPSLGSHAQIDLLCHKLSSRFVLR